MREPWSHTGRELELMLAGRKPLAAFCVEADALPCEELIPEDAFSPFVQSKQMQRQDFDLQSNTPSGAPVTLRLVMYALPGEEWRMSVMLKLMQALHSGGGWNETCERVEGSLLGYSDAENDTHCAQRFRRVAP